MRAILQIVIHSQPPTPIKTDDTTATGFVYKNIQLKISKLRDMRHYWLRDKETRKYILKVIMTKRTISQSII